ncbi:MAG: 2-hydroxyacyl-CoA dehydratase family protein [Dehalococcoidia bacterium]|nr:2-hydroxyacyl-CoA dehydratase family protein [Dehalococcoidia bacterium]
MKVSTIDLSQHRNMVDILGKIATIRQGSHLGKSDELYYSMQFKYQERLHEAAQNGQTIAAHTVVIPVEIMYAMDIVPMHLEFTANTMAISLKQHEEMFSAAKAMGYTPEVCSAHRILAAMFAMGWAPVPSTVIWSNQVCDNTAKCGDQIIDSYRIPGFFLDRPFRYTAKETDYLTQELSDMVAHLEEISGRRMDWDKFGDVMKRSARMVELHREIYQLRQAIPYPTHNRHSSQIMVIMWYWMGTPEGLNYLETVRDELAERVNAGIGYAPEEKYRLLGLFIPPFHKWKLLDWMERVHGASIVAEPYSSHWGEWDYDPTNPLKSLAVKQFISPICQQMHGPMEEGVVADAIADAISHKVQGAVYWAHTGCRQACATIRATKDALSEELEIPTMVVDMDIIDPTFVSEDEMKDKLESFFELLDERQ